MNFKYELKKNVKNVVQSKPYSIYLLKFFFIHNLICNSWSNCTKPARYIGRMFWDFDFSRFSIAVLF